MAKARVKEEYVLLREGHARKQSEKNLIVISEARSNRVQFTSVHRPAKPSFTGVRYLTNFPLKKLVAYIDWTPFFQTWMLAGRFPQILQDNVVGKEATKLYADAQKMLEKIVSENLLQANAAVGFFKAFAEGDDVVLPEHNERLFFLRQQNKKAVSAPNYCLSDYIASPGTDDHIGMFAVTTGLGLEDLVKKFKADHDDYSEIMAKALADRLAEAFAECLHELVRKELWGYAKDETLSNEQLIDEKYAGIRPAPGYPACPDHTEKKSIFRLLNAEAVGISLTDSMAMWPASSVSGYYFSHPEARYFGLGKIGKDQVEDYARRKKLSLNEVEQWLGPVLGY